MRNFKCYIADLRKRVFAEVARLAYEGGDYRRMEKLPYEIEHYFNGTNLMIIFPDQYGGTMDEMTFAQPQHTEEDSAYDMIHNWIAKHWRHKN